MFYIGFDIGGTKIEGILISIGETQNDEYLSKIEFTNKTNGTSIAYILEKKRMPTERHKGYAQILDKISQITKDLCLARKIHLNDLLGIGLSLPGPVNPKTKQLVVSNSMVMVGHNLSDDIKEKLSITCEIHSENDANCFALAEAYCGVGLDYFKETGIPIQEQNSIGLILGSGLGGGIIINGKIMTGKHGAGGEIGHVTLYPEGHPCYCGRRGCAEQYLSGPALEAALNLRIYSQIPKRPSCAEIFDLYDQMDPAALAVIKQYKKDLAFYLGNLTNLFDPDYFVFGGGVSLQPLVYKNLDLKIKDHTFLPNQKMHIYKHKIGDSAGAIGAIMALLNIKL
jgi:predicted NBD/HSP70 family sugar kinase